MVSSLLVFALLSVAQLTYGREFLPSGHASHFIRNGLPRSDSTELEDANVISINNPMIYSLRQNDVRPPSEGEVPLVTEIDNSYPILLQEREPIMFLKDRHPLSSEQMIKTESDLFDLQNLSRESSLDEDNLSSQELFLLQKRLYTKGRGLLGSSRSKGLLGSSKGLFGSRRGLLGSTAGKQTLIGFSPKSRTKGLVLSIDLGIKALRDAILHAKVKQKNMKHYVQAQKNMQLLHNIGKRDTHIQTTADRFDEHLN